MSELITVANYAKLHGVTPQAIYNQINAGIIKQLAPNTIDREQADRAWASQRRVRVTDDGESDAGRRSAQAKIAGGVAKLRLIRHRYERLQASHVDYKEKLQDVLGDVEIILAALRDLPKTEAEAVATALGIDPAIAADLLAEFTDLVLGELGDLAGEARAAFGAI